MRWVEVGDGSPNLRRCRYLVDSPGGISEPGKRKFVACGAATVNMLTEWRICLPDAPLHASGDFRKHVLVLPIANHEHSFTTALAHDELETADGRVDRDERYAAVIVLP